MTLLKEISKILESKNKANVVKKCLYCSFKSTKFRPVQSMASHTWKMHPDKYLTKEQQIVLLFKKKMNYISNQMVEGMITTKKRPRNLQTFVCFQEHLDNLLRI